MSCSGLVLLLYFVFFCVLLVSGAHAQTQIGIDKYEIHDELIATVVNGEAQHDYPAQANCEVDGQFDLWAMTDTASPDPPPQGNLSQEVIRGAFRRGLSEIVGAQTNAWEHYSDHSYGALIKLRSVNNAPVDYFPNLWIRHANPYYWNDPYFRIENDSNACRVLLDVSGVIHDQQID